MLPWLHEELEANWAALQLLGATFQRARLAHRWTQSELGDRVEIDQTSVSLFERGRFPGLRVILLIRMATALGLDIDGLAPRHRFVDDAVLEALRIARLEAEGRICPTCRHEL